VISGLAKDGFARPSGKPQLISAAEVGNAQRGVTLGCKLPEPLNAKQSQSIGRTSRHQARILMTPARISHVTVESLARERSGK
jgi:hypothetical protein